MKFGTQGADESYNYESHSAVGIKDLLKEEVQPFGEKSVTKEKFNTLAKRDVVLVSN